MKDVCEGFKCNGLIVFSQRGGKFKKSTTHMLPHLLFPSPPPPTPLLSGSPSLCRGETPIPSNLEANFPEPEVPRQVRLVGDADFCRDRAVVELPEPEALVMGAGVDVLTYAVNTSLQVGEERLVTYVDEETPTAAQEERASGWESDADVTWSPGGKPEGYLARPESWKRSSEWSDT